LKPDFSGIDGLATAVVDGVGDVELAVPNNRPINVEGDTQTSCVTALDARFFKKRNADQDGNDDETENQCDALSR